MREVCYKYYLKDILEMLEILSKNHNLQWCGYQCKKDHQMRQREMIYSRLNAHFYSAFYTTKMWRCYAYTVNLA